MITSGSTCLDHTAISGTGLSPPEFQQSRSSEPGRANVSVVTRAESDLESCKLYQQFFLSLKHAVFLVDLNVNLQAVKPHLLNPAAIALSAQCAKDILSESQLLSTHESLNDLIYTMRRKVGQQTSHQDIIRLWLKSGSKVVEEIYNLTASIFNTCGDNPMLSIVLMELPKAMKQEKDALADFKASLTCALSHELNNPMNSLIPILKMMQGCMNCEIEDNLKDVALASALILQNKIRDMIDYVKIEMKDFRLDVSEFYVKDLFDDLKQIFRFEVSQKKNSLITKINAGKNKKLLILADRNRIEQVLVKLISNSNKFTSGGQIWLTATESKETLDVTFTVRDTGVGMAKGNLELVLASFSEKARYLRENKEFARLPGLGLEIAKNICQQMESELTMVSEEKRGSEFSFKIPVCAIFQGATYSGDVIPFTQIHTNPSRNNSSGTVAEEGDKRRGLGNEGRLQEEDKLCVRAGNYKTTNQEQHTSSAAVSVPPKTESQDLPHHTKPNRRILSKTKTTPEGIRAPDKSEMELPPETMDERVDVHSLIPCYKTFVRSGMEFLHPPSPVPPFPKADRSTSYMNVPKQGKVPALKIGKERENVVLVTDDQYSNRMVLCEMLRRLKVATVMAIDGSDAVKCVEKSFSDESKICVKLVLMDLNMPVMDGVQATSEIRKLERASKRPDTIPIVAVTAHDSTDNRNDCFALGFVLLLILFIYSIYLFY